MFVTASEAGFYYKQQSFVGHQPSTGLTVGANYGYEYRNYLLFDIPVLPTNLLSAELWLSSVFVNSKDGAETYELSEVTNSVETIHAYGSTEPDVFNDLGDGAFYGSVVFTPLDSGQTLVVPLNSEFISKLFSSQGQQLILGGHISSINTDETDLEFLSGPGNLEIHLALTFSGSNDTLTILQQPLLAGVLDGQEWVLQVRACGADPIAYQWQRDGADISGATNSILHFQPARLSDTGTYTVVLSNSQNVVTSTPAALQVDALRLSVSGDALPREGSDFTLYAFVDSVHPVTFQWFKEGILLPDSNISQLAFVNATTNDGGHYSVVASNIAGSATSGVFTVQIISQPPGYYIPFVDQTAAEGSTVIFSASAYGNPPPTYYWLFNGAPLNAPPGPELMLVDVDASDAGRYSVVASNRLGSAINSALLSIVPAGPLDHWTLRNPSPQPNDLHNLVYVDGRFFAVGINGALLTSTNGHDWAIQQSRTTNELRGITYGGGLFVVVGYQIILTSTNGVNWRNFYPGQYDLTSVTYGNGRFVAANYYGYGTSHFLTSTNAVDWEPIDLGYNSFQKGVTFANGKFAAAAWGNGMVVFTSTNGLDWETQALGSISRPEAVRYAGGRFVLVGSEGTVFTSNDGSQWIKRTTGASARFINIDYGNGAYVAVGVRGTILRSTDLLHWTTVNSGTPDRLEGIVFAQGKFLALGESGTTLISTDGVTWVNQGQGTHLDLDGITLGEGSVVMAVGKGGTILTTANGTDFNLRNSGATNDLHGITFATWREPVIGVPGGFSNVRRYVAVGAEGTILISDNGFNWTRRAVTNNTSLKAVIYGRGLFVAVGTLGTILTSVDGMNWRTEQNPIGFVDLNDVAFGNGTFVVATDGSGATGTLLSPDGHSWSALNIGSSRNSRGVTFAQDMFALVGNDGNVFFSNGAASGWIRHSAGIFRDGDNLRGVTYADGLWVIVGNGGIILTSPDTFNWTRRYSPVFVNLHGVCYLNGTFVAIGNAGTVLQSDRFAPLLEGARTPGGFRLTIHPGIGNSLRLQKSSTLLNWTDLTTITNPPNPSTFLDTSNTNVVGVYRVISP